MLAYACVPGGGSEPGVGWNRAVQAGRFVDTWVICEGRECEAALTEYIDEHGPVPGVTFHFVPLSPLEMTLRSIPGGYYLAYNLWHRRAFALAKELHDRHQFDLAHQVNLVSFREPGYLWRLQIPFVWGPFGGTQNFPTAFLNILPPLDAAKELFRTALNTIQLRLGRRQRRVARSAAVVIAANSTVEQDLSRAWEIHPRRLLETGVTGLVDPHSLEHTSDGEFRILWVGHVFRFKALTLLISALAELPERIDWKLRVIGDGPLLSKCKRQAARLGISDRIEWLGWQPRRELCRHYSWASVFAFTSLRDTSGNVVLEALSHGLPVVCLNHQGVADMVTPECGIKIPVESPSQVIRDLANSLHRLADDLEKCERLSRGAFERADLYSWSRLGNRMAEVYRGVLAAAGSDAIPHERRQLSNAHVDSVEVGV